MLYKLKKRDDKLDKLELLPFMDFEDLDKLEKDLEILLANHILDVLFEDAALMPILQERALQAEADLYALNKDGDLVIFELKRGLADEEAMHQALRYSQDAGQWTFSQLELKYKMYLSSNQLTTDSLSEAHKEAFNLDRPLLPSEFNRRQHLVVVGNAANDRLINAVAYWKGKGLSVEFLPYRIYEINDRFYFEFFALPYDRHQNPAAIKGVLFDTNRSFDEDAIWGMMEESKVAAYGNTRYVVEYLNPKDIVFFSHKGVGLVAAAEVISSVKSIEPREDQYRDVRFLTPTPERQNGVVKYMSFSEVSKTTGKTFFWARTIKVPYLTRSEALSLVDELNKVLT